MLDRRALLRSALLAAGGVLLPARALLAGEPTPAQAEGPFHPLRRSGPDEVDFRLLKTLDRNTDLTRVDGHAKRAQGQVLDLLGVVTDEKDVPLAGAEVEIWQACKSGRYNHRRDGNDAWLDPDFQYWGIARTDKDGRYAFRTVLPGAYRNDPSWVRPPHIHCKVRGRNRPELTTQLYFSGASFELEGKTHDAAMLRRLNERDLLLRQVPASDRARLVAPVREHRPEEHDVEPGSRYCTFDLVLPSARAIRGG